MARFGIVVSSSIVYSSPVWNQGENSSASSGFLIDGVAVSVSVGVGFAAAAAAARRYSVCWSRGDVRISVCQCWHTRWAEMSRVRMSTRRRIFSRSSGVARTAAHLLESSAIFLVSCVAR